MCLGPLYLKLYLRLDAGNTGRGLSSLMQAGMFTTAASVSAGCRRGVRQVKLHSFQHVSEVNRLNETHMPFRKAC